MKRSLKKTQVLSALCSFLLLLTLLLCSCSSQGNAFDGNYGNVIEPESPNYSGKDSVSSGLIEVSDVEESGQKIIRTCTIEGETREFDTTSAALSDAISAVGGYIESQSSTGISYGSGRSSRRLTATVRVPADKYEDFVSGLGRIMNVTSSSSSAENVTEAYYDAAARLETLKAERESLQKMMASIDTAVQYDFWLTLQKRLSETEQDIAALEARLRTYDNRVSYSTVTINLREVLEFTPAESPTFGSRISKAFSSSWQSFGEFWQDVAVFIVSALPAIITLAVIVLVIVVTVLAATRKNKK
ncbi:MAG: DUF4349 domain-containing protein [Clostridiales bacterium]|nr:DUF4349 domain-containing protein [Clostridiales bacterium]